MFARVSCPACKYQFSIPEGEMARRHVCPNCQSPFIAGKSVAEAAAATATSAAAQPGGYAKTMLGEAEPPIKYNCPRCKAALEAPVSEAGTKKPCPACGQRLQVPNPPPNRAVAAAPARGLDKTMLATDERAAPPQPPIKYNCPNCKKPLEAPASEGGDKKNCPACGQRLQVPAAPALVGPNLNKTMLASDGATPAPSAAAAYAAPAAAAPGSPASSSPALPAKPTLFTPRNIGIAAGVLFVLLFIVPALFRGGKTEDTAALARAKEEFEKFKAEVERKQKELDRETAHEAKIRHDLESLVGKYRDLEERLRREHRDTLREITDAKQRAALEEKFEAAQRRFEREKAEMEKSQQKLLEDAKARLDESKRALDASRQDQLRTQTIIQQPPVIYYPPYDWRYWRPW